MKRKTRSGTRKLRKVMKKQRAGANNEETRRILHYAAANRAKRAAEKAHAQENAWRIGLEAAARNENTLRANEEKRRVLHYAAANRAKRAEQKARAQENTRRILHYAAANRAKRAEQKARAKENANRKNMEDPRPISA